MEAIILILKHATLSRLSYKSSEAALAQAEKDYCAANIDSKIQQFLAASSRESSTEKSASFVMATDMSKFIFLHEPK